MTPTDLYDEAKIVSLFTEIYKLQHLLCYYPDQSVIYAPPTGHQIDEATCDRVKLSSAVISLMKKIPYPKDSEEIAYSYPFINHSTAAVYTEVECIIAGRDPENYNLGKPLRADVFKPSEIALTFAKRDGVNIILDTNESSY
jgi:hypothetical protein